MERRTFIGGVGAAAAGLALGACGDDGSPTVPQARDDVVTGTTLGPGGNPLDTFDHVVVVMFENRSFDNLLGGLYGAPGSPDPRFDGVFTTGSPGYVSNPSPFGSGLVYASATNQGVAPSVDPGECYADINAQLWGAFNPPSNVNLAACPPGAGNMTAPWNVPAAGGPTDMSGFALDYRSAWNTNAKADPSPEDVAEIMQYFSAETLPVTNALAKGFGVFDHWFCDVPSDTFVNRSFFHAAASTGFVTEPPFSQWPLANTAETILNRMADADVSWNVFFDPWQVVPLTLLINFRSLWPHLDRFKHIDTFFDQAASGELPQYTFIEPRMLTIDPTGHPESDMHPTFFKELGQYVISDVRDGDAFLHQVYDAIRTSPARDRTLLLMVFDEHGGMADHVSPPSATPPGDGAPGEYGFTFDRLGVRIPAIAISSYVPEGAIVSDQMQNTSVIRTLNEKWGLAGLTARDASAPRFDGIIDPSAMRDWPTTTPPDLSSIERTGDGSSQVNGLARAIMASAQAAAAALPRLQAGEDVSSVGDQDAAVPAQLTVGQVQAALEAANETLQVG